MLRISMIPRSMRGRNLRNDHPDLWEEYARLVKLEAGFRCEICGVPAGSSPGPYGLEAHEVWGWNWLTGTQYLRTTQSLCQHCHRTVHLDLTRQYHGRVGYRNALRHLAEVNDWGWWRCFLHVQFAGISRWLREQRGGWHLSYDLNRVRRKLDHHRGE